MSVEMVIFDMAGTTVQDKSYVASAFQKAFLSVDIEVTEEDVNPVMGYHKPLAIQMVLEKYGVETDPDLITHIHDLFLAEMLDFYEYSPFVQAMPDAEDVFFFLKEKGVKIALNTGFSRDIAEVIVDRFQWLERGLIDDFIASDEVEQGRPYPDMIRVLKKRNGISEGGVVMKVGDTVVDILEGRNANCTYVVAVTTGAATREELSEHKPSLIIDNLSALTEYFKELKQDYA